MANIVIILGKSGTGKSTSIKTLDPKKTIIINTLKKRLPFKGSNALYNEANKNIFNLDEYDKVISYIENISEKSTNTENIVIDDAIYSMRKEYFRRAKESGYGKYTELAQHFQQIISTCENARENLNVFLMLHSEDVVSDGSTTEYKVATIGKLLDSQLTII